jgi:plastocyanin
MRKSKTFRSLTPAVAAFAALGLLAGCGGSDDGDTASEGPQEMPFDVATAGHVQGMIMFEGEVPQAEAIDMASEPACQSHWADQGITPTRDIVQVEGGHIANVLVYVKEGLGDLQFPTPRQAVVIDQVGCRYTPHVAAVQTGQTLTFRNSDGLLHNVNATPQVNRPFNFSQPVNMDTNRTLAQAEVAVPVRCDVHGWMRAYVGVTSHPYNAVTGDGGTFSLRELPPGDYVIEAWHPQLGTMEQSITVATGETAQVSFTYTADMLANAVVPMGDPIDPHDHNPLVERLLGASGHDHHVHSTAAPASDRR